METNKFLYKAQLMQVCKRDVGGKQKEIFWRKTVSKERLYKAFRVNWGSPCSSAI